MANEKTSKKEMNYRSLCVKAAKEGLEVESTADKYGTFHKSEIATSLSDLNTQKLRKINDIEVAERAVLDAKSVLTSNSTRYVERVMETLKNLEEVASGLTSILEAEKRYLELSKLF